MTNNTENCMTKTKTWLLEFYKSPCFLLKLFLSLTVVTLAIIGIYKIAASAIFYFDEPLSSFDPERLGQLGDFLGGTLNPIFGFLTVCLLLWSIKIQASELRETKEEIRRSTAAFNKQNLLLIGEYTRSELMPILNKLYDDYESTITEYFLIPVAIPNDEILSLFINIQNQTCLQHLNILSTKDELSEYLNKKFIHHDTRSDNFFSPIWDRINKIKEITNELHKLNLDYIEIAQLKTIEKLWFTKYSTILKNSVAVGAINNTEYEILLSEIVEKRNMKWENTNN